VQAGGSARRSRSGVSGGERGYGRLVAWACSISIIGGQRYRTRHDGASVVKQGAPVNTAALPVHACRSGSHLTPQGTRQILPIRHASRRCHAGELTRHLKNHGGSGLPHASPPDRLAAPIRHDLSSSLPRDWRHAPHLPDALMPALRSYISVAQGAVSADCLYGFDRFNRQN
jgi:hypothetical protein